MLALVLLILFLATTLWCQIGKLECWCKFYSIYVVTWSFWIPACSYGIAVGQDIPPPYLIIAAFLSHGNALANAFLYGTHLFHIIGRDEVDVDNSKLVNQSGSARTNEGKGSSGSEEEESV